MVWTLTIRVGRRSIRTQIVSTDLRVIRDCIDNFAGHDYPGLSQAFTARNRNELCKNRITSFYYEDKQIEVKLL